MKKHILNEHMNNNHNVNFKWKVLRKFQKPLQRQIFEAIKIKNTASDVIMNSKHEFNSINTVNSHINNCHYQCHDCGGLFKDERTMKNHMKDFHEKTACEKCKYILQLVELT